MLNECTDCGNCASFAWGWRVICLSEKLQADTVCEYFPVGERNAANCPEFDEDEPSHYSMEDWDIAEQYSEDKFGDVNYSGIRAWVETTRGKK